MDSSDRAHTILTRALARLLEHPRDRTPPDALSCDPAALCDAALHHGVLPLIADRLAGDPRLTPALRDRLDDAARLAVVDDLVQSYELARLLAATARAGLRPIVIKGAHLAHAYYPRPDLRPRVDSDLLIAPEDDPAVAAVLTSLGYARVAQSDGGLLSYQTTWTLARDGAPRHVVDLHRRLTNAGPFGAALSYATAAAEAVPVPSLGEHARGLAPAHALLVACVHPIAHHPDDWRLIWAHDIREIARRLTPASWRAFGEAAQFGRVTAACRTSLTRTMAIWTIDVAPHIWTCLTTANETDEGPYLQAGRRHVHRIWADLQAQRSWRDRVQLLRQHVFPPAEYMRQVYAPSSPAPLSWLYARRAWRGAQKWFARP